MKTTKKIEQVTKNGNIVIDYDNKLVKNEILSKIYKNIKNLTDISLELKNKYFYITYKNKKLILYFKNLTYTGNPHPIHKKRIQVGLNEEELKNYLKGYLNIIGIYCYENNLTFIFPELRNPEKRKWKNDSLAYIHTTDLIQSNKFGNFKKIDKNDNTIYLFQNFIELIDFILNKKNFDYKNLPLKILNKFFEEKIETSHIWYGKKCYDQMIQDKFNSKYYAEWIGAYFEYIFYQYLTNNKISKNIFEYLNINKNLNIFDLLICKSFYGDLKTHSIYSSSILGNDLEKVNETIKKYNKLWLITLIHNPIFDEEFNYELSMYWNKLQNKKNEKSYQKRMKNRTQLVKILILEINKQNIQHMKIFKQGKNSDKKSNRKPKIKIDNKDFENFIIYRKFLNSI